MTEPLKLTKDKPLKLAKSLQRIRIGLGWEVLSDALDLDVSVVALQFNGRVKSNSDICFYGQLSACNGAIVSAGDDRTGGSSVDGDDETITIDLTKLPDYVDSMQVLISIYEAEERKHKFGLLTKAYAKVYDDVKGTELAYIDLDEVAGDYTAVKFAKLVKVDGSWVVQRQEHTSDSQTKLKGIEADLGNILKSYGAVV